MHTYHYFLSFWYNCWLELFCLFLSLSPSLSNSLRMALKRKSVPSWNPLCSRASSSDSTPLHVKFRDDKARQDFSENFSKCGIHSECHVIYQTSLIPLFPLSFIVGVRSLFVRSRWVVPSRSYRSFTLICTDLIILYLISSLLFEVSV